MSVLIREQRNPFSIPPPHILIFKNFLSNKMQLTHRLHDKCNFLFYYISIEKREGYIKKRREKDDGVVGENDDVV